CFSSARRGSRRRRRCRTRTRSARSRGSRCATSRRPNWSTSTRTRSTPRCGSSKARPAAWASTSFRGLRAADRRGAGAPPIEVSIRENDAGDDMATVTQKKVSKRYDAAAAKIAPDKQYSFEEAVELLKSMPAAKFDQSVDLSFRLGVDPKHADQMVRGAVVMPHGIGKTVRVAV